MSAPGGPAGGAPRGGGLAGAPHEGGLDGAPRGCGPDGALDRAPRGGGLDGAPRGGGPDGALDRAPRGGGLDGAPRGGGLDRALFLVGVALILGAAISLLPGVHVRVVAPSLDLALGTIATLVTLSVCALGWVRYRERREPAALFEASAFLALTIANAYRLALVISGLDARVGMALWAPGQGPLYISAAAGLQTGVLLVVGGLEGPRVRHPRRPELVMLASALAMIVLIALVEVSAGALPALGSVTAAGTPATPPAADAALPSPTLLGLAVAAVVSGLFLWAAALSRRRYVREGSIGDAYLTVGLVFAAFGHVATGVYPAAYSGLVETADLLRLAFDVILLLGIQAETGATLRRLRQANEDLARLHAAEVDRAALEERARLSRELHDGLAQSMWLAKLTATRLAALPDLGLEARALTDELGDTIDAGLTEAQQAVAALRLQGEPGSLRALMSRAVNEFADRFGMRVEFDCPADLPALSPRAEGESLRIVQEALNNVRRHADATVVRVSAAMADGRLILRVGDNGRGFDPDALAPRGFGLVSMRERAALIGAELSIDSRPRDGTRVSLSVPLGLALAPAAVTS